MKIKLLDQDLILLPEKALYWEQKKTLVVSDLHLGKAAFFRNHSFPLPAGTTKRDMDRLTALIEDLCPERLLILGDLLHAKEGRAERTFNVVREWRSCYASLKIVLVPGNHDTKAGDPPTDWNFEIADQIFFDAPFYFSHIPEDVHDSFCFSGHVHPAVSLKGPGKTSETLPCFYFKPQLAILPAFGSFTGKTILYPEKKDSVFAIAGDKVIKVH